MPDNIISLNLITIYKNILKDSVVNCFIDFLKMMSFENDFSVLLKKYTDFAALLYENQENLDFSDYLKKLIYKDENIISKGCSGCIKDNARLLETARYELNLFDKILEFDYNSVKNMFLSKFPHSGDILNHLPVFYSGNKNRFNIDDVIKSYKSNGYGVLSCYNAFKYNKNKEIIPVKYPDSITFNDLKNYEYQQNILKKNTLAFLNGKEANNILLYGDRGCGKSSSVKALINEYSNYNLKIIQLFKESFIYLPDLYEKIRNLPCKFIIFADDISFNEDDKDFSSIKAALEGSLTNKPSNSVIYITTNRMHLVKESFSAREGNEIHYNDTIDEMVSLSDRFGIMLTFSILNKSEYLDIVTKIAEDCCIKADDNLLKKAEEFSCQKGIRTPRIARQFITNYISINEL